MVYPMSMILKSENDMNFAFGTLLRQKDAANMQIGFRIWNHNRFWSDVVLIDTISSIRRIRTKQAVKEVMFFYDNLKP